MSAPPVGAPDPLEALRAADHRPRHVVLREHVVAAWNRRVTAASSSGPGRAAISVTALLVVVAVGWRLFAASQPPVEASLPLATAASVPASTAATGVPSSVDIDGASTPAAVEVVVHVAGAVRDAGLVQGEPGWRVADAIDAAGGSTAAADLNRLNLAAHIADGQRIFVPTVGEPEPTVTGSTSSSGVSEGRSGPINLNTADSAELQELPGVGPATAEAILAHRESHGSFANVDALVAVRGIGPATLDGLRELVTVG